MIHSLDDLQIKTHIPASNSSSLSSSYHSGTKVPSINETIKGGGRAASELAQDRELPSDVMCGPERQPSCKVFYFQL